jgi:hypothetical protein
VEIKWHGCCLSSGIPVLFLILQGIAYVAGAQISSAARCGKLEVEIDRVPVTGFAAGVVAAGDWRS